MQGHHTPQSSLFTYVDIAELVPETHLLRLIDKHVDLSFVRALTKKFYCEKGGRPSIDPQVYFRMQIISYLYGIASERQLCEEIQVNLAYRWFLGYSLEEQIPDHSTLSKIRLRLGEESYREIFEGIVEMCMQQGLVAGRQIISDATYIQANASFESMVKRESDDTGAQGAQESQQEQGPEGSKKKKELRSNETHVSATDPDCSMVANVRAPVRNKLWYKAHYSIDGDHRIITDCHVTTGSRHESQVLTERIEYQLQRFGLPIEELIADSGYGSGQSYAYCEKQGICSYIPLHKVGRGARDVAEEGFSYNPDSDSYCCPEGHELRRFNRPGARCIKRYRPSGKACGVCRRRSECLPTATAHYRVINRNPNQDELEAVRKRQSTEYFKSKLRQRSWKIEGLFGEAKEKHNLRRAKYRRLSNIRIQVYLTATVQNLKRLAAFFFLYFLEYLHRFFSTARYNLYKTSSLSFGFPATVGPRPWVPRPWGPDLGYLA